MEPVIQFMSNYRQKFQNLYLWDLISRAIGKFMNHVGTEKSKVFPAEFPRSEYGDGDKTNPRLVRALLMYLLKKNVDSANNDACLKFNTTIQMQASTASGYILAPPTSTSYQFSTKLTLGRKVSSVSVSKKVPSNPQNSSRKLPDGREPVRRSDKPGHITCMVDFLYHNKIKLSFIGNELKPCRRGDLCPFAHKAEIDKWPSDKVWEGLKGSPHMKRASPEDIQAIKKALKHN
jgi:hypothetical protein